MPLVGSRITRTWVAAALALGAASLIPPLAWGHGGPHHHGHYGFSFGVGFGYPAWPGYYYPYAGWHYPYPGYPYPGWVAAYPPPYVGWVDLDVVPEEAEVYVGGTLIGTTDDFDGFPDYLALRPGTRVITLRHPGYQDMKLRLKVSPGVRVRINRKMVESASGRR
jgi:hypothetical protein